MNKAAARIARIFAIDGRGDHYGCTADDILDVELIWKRVEELKGLRSFSGTGRYPELELQARTEFIERVLAEVEPKVVRGTINDGLLDIHECPEGVEIEINDYDVEGCDLDEVEGMDTDENGRPFFTAG